MVKVNFGTTNFFQPFILYKTQRRISRMRKGIYKDNRLGTWYINTKVKVGDDFKVVK